MLPYIILALLSSGARSHHLVGLLAPQQFHTQDRHGQYMYGYNGGPSAKIESRTFDGVTRGGYSYIDANGIVQSVSYIADPIGGFRVAATNLPEAPTPDKVTNQVPVLKISDSYQEFFKNTQNLNQYNDAIKDVKQSDKYQEFIKDSQKLSQEISTPKPSDENKFTEYKAEERPRVRFQDLRNPPFPVPGVRAPEPYKLAAIKGLLPQVPKTVVQRVPSIKLAVANTGVNPVFFTYPYYEAPLAHYDPAIVFARSGNDQDIPKESDDKVKKDNIDEKLDRSKRSAILHAIVPTYGQYEIKDHVGNYEYGYNSPLSSKFESRSLGMINGAYSYIDANGILQQVQYIADDNGFRVSAANLP